MSDAQWPNHSEILKIVDKFTKLSKLSFTMKCFTGNY